MAKRTSRTGSKKKSTALILCILGGYLGAHQYYVGNIRKGLLYTCTLGLFTLGWFVDIFMILIGHFRDSSGALLRSDPRKPSPPKFTRLSTQDYDNMEGHEFEYFCAEILKKNSFINVEVTQGSGDHGIDVLAEKNAVTYAIQCKCYSSNVGNAAVQQAYTGKGFYRKDIAVVMTNRYFTAQAKQEAQSLGVKLWDRDKLNEMIEECNS